MVNWAMLGGGLLGGGLDALGASKAEKARKDTLKKVLAQLAWLQGQSDVVGAQQLQELQRGLGDIRGGYQRALGETRNAGMAGETAARDVAAGQVGDADQLLLSRGMYDPQAQTSLRRGISSDLMRTIAGVRERVGAARANLLAQQGLAVGGARSGIAGQMGENFGRKSSLATQALGLQLDSVPQYQPQGANLGFLLGSAFGGGGGKKAATGGGFGGGLGGFGLWNRSN